MAALHASEWSTRGVDMEAATHGQWEDYVSLVESLVEKHQAGASKTDVDGNNPPLTAAT